MASKSLTFDIYGKDVSASSALNGVGKSAGGLGNAFAKLGTIIAGAFAVEKIVDFGKEAVDAFADAETQQNKLSDAFKRFPALADVSRKSLDKLNTTLEHKSGFDDDAIASGEAVLAQFKLTGQQVQQIIPLIVDYARKTGADVPSAAENIGKALLGNTRALKSVGIEYKATGDTATDFQNIMGALQDKVGGFADAQATTTTGKLEILNAKFEDIKEKIGGALVPALDGIADVIDKDVLPHVDEFTKWIDQTGIPGIKGLIDWTTQYKDVLGPAATALGALAIAQTALNVAAEANPYIAAAAGVTTYVALLFANWDKVSAANGALIRGVGDVASSVMGSVATVVDGIENSIIDAINGLVAKVNPILSTLHLPTLKVLGHINSAGAIAALQAGADLALGGGMGSASGVGANGSATKALHEYANGGDVYGTQWAMVGERGPEIVRLPGGSHVFPNETGPGGHTYNFTINGITDPVAVQNGVLRRLNLVRA